MGEELQSFNTPSLQIVSNSLYAPYEIIKNNINNINIHIKYIENIIDKYQLLCII
jgi:hypothetical protein